VYTVVSRPEIDKFVVLMNATPHALVLRRMKFGVYYGDIFFGAIVIRDTLVLNTVNGTEARNIPLRDISRIDFMSPGGVRLMFLVSRSIQVSPGTFADGTEELDGIVLVPV